MNDIILQENGFSPIHDTEEVQFLDAYLEDDIIYIKYKYNDEYFCKMDEYWVQKIPIEFEEVKKVQGINFFVEFILDSGKYVVDYSRIVL
jgi:hypothetical protein